MARLTLPALLVSVVIVATSAAPADAADGFSRLRADIHVGFWRNTCWPKPFIYADRQAAFAPMHVMAENGWRRNNLLGAHHFAPDGTQLNTAGQLRVQWILTQAPMHRRNVYVERSFDTEVTGRRVEAVQRFAGTFAPDAAGNVFDTHILSEGRPAQDVDWANSQFRANAPIPVLPQGTTGTSVTQ